MYPLLLLRSKKYYRKKKQKKTVSVMTVAILATSGMERRDLLIATAKLQLFQGQETIRLKWHSGSSY